MGKVINKAAESQQEGIDLVISKPQK